MSQDETAVKDEVVADATATDSAPVETVSPVADDDGLEAIKDIALDPSQRPETEGQEEGDAADTAADSAEETNSQQPQTDTKQPGPEDDWNQLKGSSQERFRQMANSKRELERQMQELQAQQAQFATEQDLLNEINPETGVEYTPQEIERISWAQAREAQAERTNQELYGLQVQRNQMAINDEAERVQTEIPMLNPNSKEFDQETAQQYADLLNDNLIYALPDGQQANRATLLANGINPEQQATLVGYSVSPYKLAKFVADPIARVRAQAETVGQAKAQKATEKMLSNADPSASVPSSGGDSLDSLFDRVKDIQLS